VIHLEWVATHQMVSTSCDAWIAPSLVTSGTPKTRAVETISRSHGSDSKSREIVVEASAIRR
jgi:hypothetical protein